MKNFREAVKREMEREGWKVHYSDYYPPDLICERQNVIKMVQAKGNGHGHIYRDELKELKGLERKYGKRILIAKVNGANEIIFWRLERILKTI